ncbi:MAG: type II toxin-antitoxin system VapC family toxin [Candidatus Hodarchaeales archaeon]
MELDKVIIVDTDFLSHFLAARKSAIKMQRQLLTRKYMIATTVITSAEMYYGAIKRKWGERRISELRRLFTLLPVFPFTLAASLKYGEKRADLINKGEDIGFADTAIAAIALTASLPVLTANVSHFKRIEGLEIIKYAF